MSVIVQPTPSPAVEVADEAPDEVDGLRQAIRAMWNSVAESWGSHADYVEARASAVTATMLELAAPVAGESVLEMACGPGGPGLDAAEIVGPSGRVVLSDISPAMTAIAATRAAARRLGNVTVGEFDLERIAQPDASYDIVLCREALMLVPDPVGAARETRRVLRPAGRAVFAVWGARDRNPWLGVLFDAVTAATGFPVPPPGVPGPFSLDTPELLSSVLSEACFSDVAVCEVDNPMRVESLERWWAVVPTLAGPISQIIASLPDDVRQAIHDHTDEALRPYMSPGGLTIPGLTLVAFGTR